MDAQRLVTCPRCHSQSVLRWGRPDGRQRYRCKTCLRTFTGDTGTPLARRHKRGAWPEYLLLMQECATLRTAATRLEIHISTAFRWRHAALHALHATGQPRLAGVVELTQIPVALSDKGSRRLPPETARERGGRVGAYTSGMPRSRVMLAFCRDNGSIRSADSRVSLLLAPHVRRFLEAELEPSCTVVSAARPGSAFGSGARCLGLAFVSVHPVTRTSQPPLGDTVAVDEYARQLRKWLRGFRGVASRYLDHYLAWHRQLHTNPRPDASSTAEARSTADPHPTTGSRPTATPRSTADSTSHR
jgi:transposase-like protein